MDHVIEASEGLHVQTTSEIREDWGRVTVTATLRPGETLRLVKYVELRLVAVRSRPALRDQVAAGLTGALHTGWEGLLRDQRDFLDEFWKGADVQVEGDPELQQAVRFALFHVMQDSVRAERTADPGEGADRPRLRRPLLLGHGDRSCCPCSCTPGPRRPPTTCAGGTDARGRHASGPRTLRLAGAAFPWRTINGEECSGYWPAGTAAFHINADIADAVIRYLDATGDEEFDAEIGIELLVETARLWVSLGHHDAAAPGTSAG